MRASPIAILAGAAALALPAPAGAAVVGIEETEGAYPTPETTHLALRFSAGAAEANHLTVSVAGESGGVYELRLLDSGAPVTPGPGCSGGGPPGSAVTCLLHAPTPPKVESCARDLGCKYVPNSGWSVTMSFVLGGGGSYLDAGSLPEPQPIPIEYSRAAPIAISVTPGKGADTVTTAGGNDLVEASPGDDLIRTGAGEDTFNGGAADDGADDVDLGAGRDKADYRKRTEDIVYMPRGATSGAHGEGDRLEGIEELSSGSGDDLLIGHSPARGGPGDRLDGGAGDDVMRGGRGNDHLIGEAGDDRSFGGGGKDEIYESFFDRFNGEDFADGGGGEDHITLARGDDRALGGVGNDLISLGAGRDRGEGGGGNDLIEGGHGPDALDGGEGADRVIGFGGRDELRGGPGDDGILAGSVPSELWNGGYLMLSPGPLENVADRVDCGDGGADRVGVDRADSTTGCERVTHLRLLELDFPIFQETFHGKIDAQLQYEVRVPGVLELSGPGLKEQTVRDPAEYESFTARLQLQPVGRALRELNRDGSVRVRAKIVFRPGSGGKIIRYRSVRLVKDR